MRPPNLIQWSGPATVLGGVALILQIALSSALGSAYDASDNISSPILYAIYNLLFQGALLLFVVGLLGLHDRQANQSGRLGRASLFLAMSAGALVAAGIVATLMVGLLPELSASLIFSTELSAVFCLVGALALLGLATIRAETVWGWVSGLGWRGALLILAAGLAVALLSDSLERIVYTSYLGLRGNDLLHILVTIPVAAWVARKVGTAPVFYGTLAGLISGLANQVFNQAILRTTTISPYETATILLSCAAAGLLGGAIARSTLAEQETLYRASQAIGVVTSLQDAVDAVGEHLADPQVSHVALWQDTSRGDAPTEISLLAVWMPSARVWGPGVWQPGLRLDTAQVPALANLRRQPRVVIRTRKLPASERAMWEHQGIRSAVLLPLITSSGAQVGLLMVASRSHVLSGVKERTYLTIAAQVTLVLENLRLVEVAEQSGVSSERQRLAQEIHDTLAQAFASIVMKLEAAEGALPPNLNVVQQFLDQARSIARENLTEARRLMWALRPESLERSSLAEALERLAERWSNESGVEATTVVTGVPHPLPPEIEVTLLRAAQEGLNNCRKYAQARRVSLTLSYTNKLVSLNVRDDGVGFDPDEVSPDASDQSTGELGLVGMRERVEQLRGALMVESAPGEGTTLTVVIPAVPDKRTPGSAEDLNTFSAWRKETL